MIIFAINETVGLGEQFRQIERLRLYATLVIYRKLRRVIYLHHH